MLYELLAGVLPFQFSGLRLDEILRLLRDDEAQRPSAKFRSLAYPAAICCYRQTSPERLARRLKGDLDAIVLNALQKDRSRRYGGPSEFAADIARHLRHEAVAARPASIVYRARKYVQRHWSVGAVVSVLASRRKVLGAKHADTPYL